MTTIGVTFDDNGRDSSLGVGQRVIAAATADTDTAATTNAAAEAKWRTGYVEHFVTLTRLEAHHHASRIAGAGLAALQDAFVFRTPEAALSLQAAVTDAPTRSTFQTVDVSGEVDGRQASDYTVPFGERQLSGSQLLTQLDEWVANGVVEPSFADAQRLLVDNPDWLDLSDLTFAIIGAGSELGPTRPLLRWGARVYAVDVARPELWRSMIDVARHSRGHLSIPVASPSSLTTDDEIARSAGIDAVTQLPELSSWISDIEGPYTLGNYAYADGREHVRVSVAVDAVMEQVLSERSDVSLSFLATPTDAYAVPMSVVDAARNRYEHRSGWAVAGHGVTARAWFRPNYRDVVVTPAGDRFGISDALVVQQGPNYALAKRIQRWRAMHARLSHRLVSINVAPAARTRSVVRNRLLAAAYAGAARFGLEVFDPATASTLMAGQLVHDLRNPSALSQPGVSLPEPYRFLVDGAAHGGMWRTAYDPRSVLPGAVALGVFGRR